MPKQFIGNIGNTDAVGEAAIDLERPEAAAARAQASFLKIVPELRGISILNDDEDDDDEDCPGIGDVGLVVRFFPLQGRRLFAGTASLFVGDATTKPRNTAAMSASFTTQVV